MLATRWGEGGRAKGEGRGNCRYVAADPLAPPTHPAPSHPATQRSAFGETGKLFLRATEPDGRVTWSPSFKFTQERNRSSICRGQVSEWGERNVTRRPLIPGARWSFWWLPPLKDFTACQRRARADPGRFPATLAIKAFYADYLLSYGNQTADWQFRNALWANYLALGLQEGTFFFFFTWHCEQRLYYLCFVFRNTETH